MKIEQLEAGILYECKFGFFRRLHLIQLGRAHFVGGRTAYLAGLDGKRTIQPLSWFANRALRAVIE